MISGPGGGGGGGGGGDGARIGDRGGDRAPERLRPLRKSLPLPEGPVGLESGSLRASLAVRSIVRPPRGALLLPVANLDVFI